ncbi:MAG: cbb3-type cytochrome oxidase assembly protein CcoS [Gammaproteobacteria bacterium]|nr:cbb3-type cytochrome oxidase assembly protein CcoS [Gammaproteobacteria bacterium]
MEVIYTLVPAMIVLGLVLVGILVWAVKKGQYEDFEGEANRILLDEDEPLTPRTRKKADPNWPDADED